MKYINLVVVAMLGAGLAGCTTMEISSKKAAAFEGDITQFVEARFLSPKIWEVNKREDLLKPDGTVVYTAWFNRINYKFLLRPRNEFRKFCIGKGGQMTALPSGDYKRIINTINSVPLKLGTAAARQARAAGWDKSMASWYGRDVMEDQRRIVNSRHSQVGSGKLGLQSAGRRGAFGHFSCKQHGKEQWFVTLWIANIDFTQDKTFGVNTEATMNIKVIDVKP